MVCQIKGVIEDMREITNGKLEVLNRYCPICRSELKYKRVLETYPFSDFYSATSRRRDKGCIKLVRLSGCKGKHVFLVYFLRELRDGIPVLLKIRVFQKDRPNEHINLEELLQDNE